LVRVADEPTAVSGGKSTRKNASPCDCVHSKNSPRYLTRLIQLLNVCRLSPLLPPPSNLLGHKEKTVTQPAISSAGPYLAIHPAAVYLVMCCCGNLAFMHASPSAIAEDAARTAAIEGTITDRADPAKRWRYARYYVRNANTGELAEAIVALRGRNLRSEPVAAVEPHLIDQKNYQFVPETVALRVGESVKFTNSDQITHNVRTANEVASFNVNLPFGGEYIHRFDRAGGVTRPVEIGCVYHGGMRMWIYVFDHPHFQLTAADGKFRLEGIPPGLYDLDIVHPAGGMRSRQRVDLKAGVTARVDIRLAADDKLDASN
jgi:plastocyanin